MKKSMYCMVLSGALCAGAYSYGDTISVHNTTQETLYVAPYYLRNEAERLQGPLEIKAGQTVQIERPARKYWYDRELAYTPDPETLKAKFDKITFDTLSHVNIGLTQGSHFYLAAKDGRLKSYTALQWHITHPLSKAVGSVTSLMTEPIRNYIKDRAIPVLENPYTDMVAEVRLGNGLSLFEKDFLKKRQAKVKNTLELVLGMSLEGKTVPQIAVVASGGGYRAALVTLGFFLGFEKLGLVGAITYAACLSGSTWMIGPWIASGRALAEYAPDLRKNLGQSLSDISKNEMVMMMNSLLVKLAFDQPITFVDLYGLVLGNKLLSYFGIDRYRTYLSDQRERVANGDWFLPLYTSVEGRASVRWDTPWFEFNPYEIGSADYEAYIPSWSFGRKFVDGESVDFAPEQPFSFELGTFGSAFAASVDFIWQEIESSVANPILKAAIENVLVEYAGGHRVSSAKVYNFLAGVSGDLAEEAEVPAGYFPRSASPTSYLRSQKYIELIDGGLGHTNLPYPVVSGMRPERRPDILIFVDGSAGITGASELRKAEEFARNYGLDFPVINYEGIDKRTISVFKDEENPAVPVVIYLPRYNDQALVAQFVEGSPETGMPGQAGMEQFSRLKYFDVDACVSKEFCSTYNLQWKAEDAQQMSDVLEFNVQVNGQAILDAIKWTVENHMPRTWGQ